MKNILVLNGPNINMLGKREPHLYGGADYNALLALIEHTSCELGIAATERQSNSEGVLVSYLQKNAGSFDAAVVNAAALTHTSVALRDALLATALPFAEVHISNIYKREPFRHVSYLSDIACCVICGAGINGYAYAMRHMATLT